MLEEYDENLLLGYLEGDLDGPGVAKVQAWMRADPQLEQLLRQMIADRQAMRSMPDPPAPGGLMEQVERQLERAMLLGPQMQDEAVAAHQRFKIRRWAMAAAVAAMLAVVTGWVAWSVTPAGRWTPQVVVDSSKPQPPAQPRPPRESGPEPSPPQVQPDAPPAVATAAQPIEITLPWEIDLKDLLVAPAVSSPVAAVEVPAQEDLPPDADAPRPRLFGRVDPPADLSRSSAARVVGEAAMKELAAALSAHPAMAQRCRVEIVTRDRQRTQALLSEFSGEDFDAQRPRLHVDALRLPAAIKELRDEPVHLSVQIYGPSEVDRRAVSAEPDYARILTDQLPLAQSEAPAAILSIPITIIER